MLLAINYNVLIIIRHLVKIEMHNFCNIWGLEVNMEKTKVMITGHEPKGLIKPNFKLGNLNVKYTDEYCYLSLV